MQEKCLREIYSLKFINEERKAEISYLSIHLKKLEEQQQIKFLKNVEGHDTKAKATKTGTSRITLN